MSNTLVPPTRFASACQHGLLSFLLFGATATYAACPTWPTADRFVFNGEEVTDTRTNLIWARCTVGQNWNGRNCVGDSKPMMHEAALTYSNSQSGWRLPNVKELSSLADKGCSNPAIDSEAFPDTPNTTYWTSTPTMYLGLTFSAWVVSFVTGQFHYNGRNSYSNRVRLVRVSP